MNLGGQNHHNEQPSESIQLLDGLLRVSQFVRLRFNEWLDRFDLNDGRHTVLSVLARTEAGVCSQAQLAERLGLSESNVSTLIERMQRDGLVTRTKSEMDRRKRLLQITSAGRAILDSVEADRKAWSDNLLKGLLHDERLRMLELLDRLGGLLDRTWVAISPVPGHSVADQNAAAKFDLGFGEDPLTPQVALRRMLLALSSSSERGPRGQEAA